jgi:NAD(P)-dependent dehydrogenase (short-subunit alcohol dehydrogenase family)
MTAPKTLALVGAGPGLGEYVAKRFGAAGFQVALLAGLRNYALALHQAVTADGIFVGHVALDLFIEPGSR